MKPLCPHCGLWHDGKIITHCLDRDPWTSEEKDTLRVQMRCAHPAVSFAPSSEEIQRRFGARNRAERS